MNVGILTHHWPYNFGANLQVLSTVQTLRQLGHVPIVLNYRPPQMVQKYDSLVTDSQRSVHIEFCEKYLPQSPLCQDGEQVRQAAEKEEIEVVLSGSDAVLRLDPRSTREDLKFPNPFWLTWAHGMGIHRTGFLAASSMGSNYLSLGRQQRLDIGRSLNQLSYVGLRDRWTMQMLRYCRPEIELSFCPDPVSNFNAVVKDIPVPSYDHPYIVMSLTRKTVGPPWIQEFVKAAHEKNVQVFSLPHPEHLVDGPFDRILELPMTPLQWYSWIQHSQGYVGNRFHPVMVSIVNQIPYVALDHYETGLRFGNRWMTLAARPLRRWMRYSSKTFDLSTRAGKTSYCLNPRQFRHRSGRDVFQQLWQSRQNPIENGFADLAKQQFRETLLRICADSNLETSAKLEYQSG